MHKLTSPFQAWQSKTNGDLMRYAVPGVWISVTPSVLAVKTYDRQNPPIYTGKDLIDALSWADRYILDNYEVEKPLDERLKDAEAEIVTLKGRVKELEAKPRGSRFALGQMVKRKANPHIERQVTDVMQTTVGDYRYQIANAVGWWCDGDLEAV